MNMIRDHKSTSFSFEDFKQSLDPAFSYMIFEKEVGSDGEGDFSEVTEILPAFEGTDLEWQVYRDEARGKILLVVKINPEQTEIIMQRILETRLSKNIICYLYRNRPAVEAFLRLKSF